MITYKVLNWFEFTDILKLSCVQTELILYAYLTKNRFRSQRIIHQIWV